MDFQRPPFDVGSALFVWSSAQGLFLAVLLGFVARGNRCANRWLAALVFVLSIELLDQLAARHWFLYLDSSRFIVFLTHPTTFLVGPLFYLYARALLGRGAGLRSAWPHFVIAGLVMVDGLPGVVRAIEAGWPSRPITLQGHTTILGFGLHIHVIASAIHSAIYVIAATRMLGQYRRSVLDQRSRSAFVHTGWLGVIGTALVVILVASLTNVLVSMLFKTYVANAELVLGITFALVVHAAGFMIVREPSVFSVPTAIALARPATADTGAVAKYARSGMEPDEVLELSDRVDAFVRRERAYLNEDLRLGDLAEAMGLSSNQLSQVLNQGLGVNFFDFINQYRVEEVKRRLRDPAAANLTHLAIALDCGFSSKSSFHRVFRRHVGTTPSAWVKTHPVRPESSAT